MAQVHCPWCKRIIEMSNCLKCKYIRKEDDISMIWCRFRIEEGIKNE